MHCNIQSRIIARDIRLAGNVVVQEMAALIIAAASGKGMRKTIFWRQSTLKKGGLLEDDSRNLTIELGEVLHSGIHSERRLHPDGGGPKREDTHFHSPPK